MLSGRLITHFDILLNLMTIYNTNYMRVSQFTFNTSHSNSHFLSFNCNIN